MRDLMSSSLIGQLSSAAIPALGARLTVSKAIGNVLRIRLRFLSRICLSSFMRLPLGVAGLGGTLSGQDMSPNTMNMVGGAESRESPRQSAGRRWKKEKPRRSGAFRMLAGSGGGQSPEVTTSPSL